MCFRQNSIEMQSWRVSALSESLGGEMSVLECLV